MIFKCVNSIGRDNMSRQTIPYRGTILVLGVAIFPIFLKLGSTPKPYKNIMLPCDSGADEAISSNSDANTLTRQHQIPRLWQYSLDDLG